MQHRNCAERIGRPSPLANSLLTYLSAEMGLWPDDFRLVNVMSLWNLDKGR